MLKTIVKKIPGARKVAQLVGLASEPPRNFLLDLLPKQSIGAEIGVDRGDFSARILQALQPKELHLIDPWEHQSSEAYSRARYGGKAQDGQTQMDARYTAVCARFAKEIKRQQVKMHRSYSDVALSQLPDDYLDWVYIDGNHLYEFVKQDLELSFRKTKVGGYVMGDDYGEGGWWEGGVKKAVDEYAGNASAELIQIQNGQFVFRKIA